MQVTPSFQQLKGFPHIAVALSGGPDSWALALLAQDYCSKNDIKLTMLTVDHRLRSESAIEAANVASICRARGIAHEILVWQHDSIATRIQEQARSARYELMLDYCAAHGIPALLTAHHADDQVETILLRFAKASDVGGLAGLRADSVQRGIRIIRPLLDYTKQQLVDYVAAAGIEYVRDPSNANTHYARARLRDARAVLEAEGLTTQNLRKFAAKMDNTDTALNYATQEIIMRHAVWANEAVLELPLAALAGKPAALQQRALIEIWRRVTGKTDYAPESDTLQNAMKQLEVKLTFGGMVMEPVKSVLRFYRELNDVTDICVVAPHDHQDWDNRFRIFNHTDKAVTIAALGNIPTATIEKHCPWAAVIRPAAARAALPACDNFPVSLQQDDNSGVYAART